VASFGSVPPREQVDDFIGEYEAFVAGTLDDRFPWQALGLAVCKGPPKVRIQRKDRVRRASRSRKGRSRGHANARRLTPNGE
jgi:hypothetical protein